MVRRIANTLEDFYLGLKGDFPTVEEALIHPDCERKLIPLARPAIYSKKHHSIRYRQDGKTHILKLNPAFKDYMQEYGRTTHYVTDQGTPWLTRLQEDGSFIQQEQLDAYYAALRAGENREVVMINWTNTHGKDSGHSSISVGSLSLSENASEHDTIPIYDYTPEITGSYYGSTTPFLGMKHWDEYMRDSAVRKVGKNNPIAHATGTTLRDGALPIATFVGGAMLALAKDIHAARAQKSSLTEKQINAVAKRGIKYLAAATVIGASTAASGLLSSSKGTLLMKEEMEGSGILATLITPAQRDILEHSLYGIYQTYYGKYNILSHNCADFTQDMLKEINVDLAPLIEEAMRREQPHTLIQQALKPFTIPNHVKPSRHGWAASVRPPLFGLYGVVELPRNLEGEQKRLDSIHSPKKKEQMRKQLEQEEGNEVVHVRPIEDLDQSTILITTPNADKKFRQRPLETFRDVMKHSLTLAKDDDNQHHFAFQPHVQVEMLQPSRSVSR